MNWKEGFKMADNKRIAAIAAVLAAIQAQRGEAVATLQPGIPEPRALQQRSPGRGSWPSPWALYGRQRIMTMRALLQRRTVLRRQ
jgi:hypothetical protein